METIFYSKGKLLDKEIVEALRSAAQLFENGEIVEVHDILLEIIYAIDLFINDEENKNV